MEPEPHVTTYRVAVSSDQAGILEVFAEVASEVPTAVRPQTEAYIKRFVASGQSWVATDADGKIIGYALAEKAADIISLAYLGVAKKARGQHISTALVSKLKESGVPIVTDVQSDNKSSMVDRFGRFGFVKTPTVFTGKTKLRWEKSGTPASRDAPT
ncbi:MULTISPECIES: GNAT family N-acetyltransferase [unclassified Bradyrhizobium]|uniref:GNAT family N-acetyltransferase n=1 Tax=unclassified Bradyrhizobium TaxID=2631580 RepID=UPI001FF8B76C|nr:MULTISPECIES: GNAT family N-acetyltransferase [unclassified Bradyrhizobium]MCK1271558.1 GNAT family N-acetyltransferase [Bradyrhizobium sp. 84]MCK1375877.1 GNAT family N-acetyltransferase [Bradyrhizobium sp. 49]MCK1508702.1 GNAT family N-acetyltransferase [Bradyrhizobium sp. 18]